MSLRPATVSRFPRRSSLAFSSRKLSSDVTAVVGVCCWPDRLGLRGDYLGRLFASAGLWHHSRATACGAAQSALAQWVGEHGAEPIRVDSLPAACSNPAPGSAGQGRNPNLSSSSTMNTSWRNAIRVASGSYSKPSLKSRSASEVAVDELLPGSVSMALISVIVAVFSKIPLVLSPTVAFSV